MKNTLETFINLLQNDIDFVEAKGETTLTTMLLKQRIKDMRTLDNMNYSDTDTPPYENKANHMNLGNVKQDY